MILNKHGNIRVIPPEIFWRFCVRCSKTNRKTLKGRYSPNSLDFSPPNSLQSLYRLKVLKGPLKGLDLIPDTGALPLYFDKLNKLASVLNIPYIIDLDRNF